jgi:hypothetical protein
VEKVNEIMDEHDRVLVGSVSCGDELLAINNQLVQHMTPQQANIAWCEDTHTALLLKHHRRIAFM